MYNPQFLLYGMSGYSFNPVNMVVTSSGSVGIGGSPTTTLDVTGTFKTSGVNTLSNLSGTGTRLVTADASGVLAAPSIGTGVLSALAVNTGSAGSFVVNGGALGTPSSGTVTNLTGTASININGTVGATTPTTGAFTTVDASTGYRIGGAAVSRKILVGNGTNYVSSTETWAVPGTSGNVLTSDGTNWTSAAPAAPSGVALLATANTFTTNGAVSAPANTFNGTWYTGGTATTTKPYLLIETTGATSTGWSTSGTGLGINAASGFAGRIIDAQVNGVSKFFVDNVGTSTFAGAISATRFVPTSTNGISMATSGSSRIDYIGQSVTTGYLIDAIGAYNTANTTRNAVSIFDGSSAQLTWSSGTNTFNALSVGPRINTSGGTTTVRGIYYLSLIHI